jgi:hypothetical protein
MLAKDLEKGRDVISPGGPQGAVQKTAPKAADIGPFRTGIFENRRFERRSSSDHCVAYRSGGAATQMGREVHRPTVAVDPNHCNPI